MQLSISHSTIQKYLKEELNVSYRKLRPVSTLYNTLDSCLQRQYAASYYIKFVQSNKRIINIDESNLSLTEFQRRGWLIKGVKNKATLAHRPSSLNLIAAISSWGESFFTINQGKTNEETFLFFIMKLVRHLNTK